MIGIVVVAHFNLAREMVAATELIVGKQEQFEYVDIFPDEDVDKIKKKLTDALKNVEAGQGAIILTDMFGGTPSNISLSFLEEGKVEVVTGTNLPMLIKLVTYRQGKDLSELAAFIASYGKKNIYLATDVLNMKKAGIRMMEGHFTIRNRLGLHARAAAQFVKKASAFQSDVWVEKDGQRVNGKSIMGLLVLACPLGTRLTVKVDGADEQEALRQPGEADRGRFW